MANTKTKTKTKIKRPTVGSFVQITNKDHDDYGKVGFIIQDDKDSKPYRMRMDNGRRTYDFFSEKDCKIVPIPKDVFKKFKYVPISEDYETSFDSGKLTVGCQNVFEDVVLLLATEIRRRRSEAKKKAAKRKAAKTE